MKKYYEKARNYLNKHFIEKDTYEALIDKIKEAEINPNKIKNLEKLFNHFDKRVEEIERWLKPEPIDWQYDDWLWK